MDPRVARSHAAVMAAATDLLVEGGPEAMTVDAVVARSGVAKSTVYRHWATRDDLVADVFDHCAPHLEEPDPEVGFEPALRELGYRFVEVMADAQWKRLVPALLLLASQHGKLGELDHEMKDRQSEVVTSVLQRGVDEGVLDPAVTEDVELVATLLIGPILMAGLVESVPLDRRFADRVIDQFLAAHRVAEAEG